MVRSPRESKRIWEDAAPGTAAAIMSRPTGKSARTISETSASDPTDSENPFHLASRSPTCREASSSTYSVMLLPVVRVVMKLCDELTELPAGVDAEGGLDYRVGRTRREGNVALEYRLLLAEFREDAVAEGRESS